MTQRLSTGKLSGKLSIHLLSPFQVQHLPFRSTNQTRLSTYRLQEKLPDDRTDSGRVPRTIECEVTRDLVDRVIPGDVVEVTGIVKVSQSEKCKSTNATKNFNS